MSVLGEEGRRRGLHGGLGGGGGHGSRRSSGAQGRSRFGSEMGREWTGRSGTSVARAKGEGGARAQVSWGSGARHGVAAASPWRFERPSSACAQEDGAAWGGREASGGSGSGEASLAGESGTWPAVRRRRTARRRRCDREGGDGGDGNLVNKMKFKNSSL